MRLASSNGCYRPSASSDNCCTEGGTRTLMPKALVPKTSVSTIPPLRYLSEKRDSNTRPSPWQGDALPTELLSQ